MHESGRADVAVLGLGASGVAAARLALKQGESVYVSDLREDPAVAVAAGELRRLGARVELGGHDLSRIAGAGTVVVSPGIPPDAPVLRGLRERGVRWVAEPGFALRFLRSPLIAVTGTNGKTTTAALSAHLLREGGVDVGLGGNIGGGFGPPASELALRDPAPAWVVLELSSFQLADMDELRPAIGVLTNLAPDHLDRYPSVEAYWGDKARLFRNAVPGSRWVLDRSPEVDALVGNAPGTRYQVSTRETGFRGGYLRDGVLTLRMEEEGEEEPLLPAREMQLLGTHNAANALAASLTARLAGLSPEPIRRGLRSFPALPHRMEPVGERDGVLWVNDSKATNVSAARSAVLSLDRPLVLLLGGKDKGEEFSPLAEVLPGRVRRVVCYGAAGPRMGDVLEGVVPVTRVEGGSFRDAVAAGAAAAHPGDVLLLAPACSSFDQFHDFQERGEAFRTLAREGFSSSRTGEGGGAG